jgi:hypothetical protein
MFNVFPITYYVLQSYDVQNVHLKIELVNFFLK